MVDNINILTFDIEEWHVYKGKKYYGDSISYLPRLENILNKILDLLESNQITATFFCLGEVAKKYPSVIKSISSRGHHIGCHSNEHIFLGDLSASTFAEDLNRATSVIEDVTGEKVDSYRAPAFSVTEDTSWALDILIESGIKFDCSIFPATRRFGGYPSFNQEQPTLIESKSKTIKEFPIPTYKILGKNIAFSGGGYYRVFPYLFSEKIIKSKSYNMFYFHLRDFDEGMFDTEIVKNSDSNYIDKFKNFYGIKGNFNKFNKLICNYNFLSVSQADEIIDWSKAPVFHLNVKDDTSHV